MSEFDDKLSSILSSPQDMEKIMSLAKELSGSLGGGGEPEAPAQPVKKAEASPFDDFDPRLFDIVRRVMGEYSSRQNDKKALVESLKPYVREERRSDLDRAVKIAKLYHAAKIVLKEFGGDFHL